jgi:hypothetical protein
MIIVGRKMAPLRGIHNLSSQTGNGIARRQALPGMQYFLRRESETVRNYEFFRRPHMLPL